MTWEKIGVIAGAIIAVGTIIAGLGYGWPWTPARAGEQLAQTTQQLTQSIDRLGKIEKSDHDAETVTDMQTRRTVLYLVLDAQIKAKDRLGQQNTQDQIDDISAKLRRRGSF